MIERADSEVRQLQELLAEKAEDSAAVGVMLERIREEQLREKKIRAQEEQEMQLLTHRVREAESKTELRSGKSCRAPVWRTSKTSAAAGD